MLCAHVTGTERHYNKVAAVNDNGDWKMFLPFHRNTIEEVALVGTDILVCLSDEGEICLINFRSGLEIARRSLLSGRRYRLLVARNSEFIVAYNASSIGLPRSSNTTWYPHHIAILKATDLSTITEGNFIDLPTGQNSGRIVYRDGGSRGNTDGSIDLDIAKNIFQDNSGRLSFLCYYSNSIRPKLGFCRIDPTDWSLKFTPLPAADNPWRWYSQSGDYALVPHLGTRRRRNLRIKLDVIDAFARKTLSTVFQSDFSSPQLKWDDNLKGYHRNKGTVELWTIDPPKQVKLIRTRNGMPPDFVDDIVWEPNEVAFWIKFAGDHRRIDFQRVDINGKKRSPVFSFQRFRDKSYPYLQDIVDLADPNRIEIRSYSNSVYIQRAWCTSNLRFRLIADGEDGFVEDTSPYPPEKLVKRFLAKSDRRHVVHINEFSKDAISEALVRLAEDIDQRLTELLQNDVLELSFKIEKRTLTEAAFFKRLTQDRIPVAPALRRLMTAYLNAHSAAIEEKGIFRQLWGPEGQGALAPAMQALLSIDPDSHDILRSYLAKRNGEYDVYSTDVIMKRYIQKSGWRNIAMIGFGIYFALIRHKDGLRAIRGGLLNEYGLLSAAEKTVSEATFAAMISQEIDQFMVYPGLGYGTKEDLYVSIQPSLELTKYGRRVLGFLSFGEKLNLKRGPEKHGWNPGFLQAVDAQRARAEKAARPWWTYVFRKK